MWLCGSCQESPAYVHPSLCTASLAYSRVLVPWGFFEGHTLVHVTIMSLSASLLNKHLIWNELRCQEEIWAQLTGYPSYTDNLEGDCAKFCCPQSKAIGKLQEQSGASGRLQAAAGCKLPLFKAYEWKREAENKKYVLDNMSGGSSPEKCWWESVHTSVPGTQLSLVWVTNKA